MTDKSDVVSTLKKVVSTVTQDKPVTEIINDKIQSLGTTLRKEIAETHQLHLEKLAKQHAAELKQMKVNTLLQWLACIAILIAAYVKDTYL